ncbi:MAG: hypothetical protein M3P44_05670 [Actinomycetota bacterium]|nr:hypothetical protein [Actinomycetota bacterium]
MAGEVDVAPAQREVLSSSQTGQRGGEEDGGVLVVGGVANERVDLLAAVEVVVAGVAASGLGPWAARHTIAPRLVRVPLSRTHAGPRTF